jgi:hypothetical protein
VHLEKAELRETLTVVQVLEYLKKHHEFDKTNASAEDK